MRLQKNSIQMIFLLLVIGISSCKKEVNYTPSGPRTPLGQYIGFTTSAHTLLKISGDNQSDTINSQLSLPLRVQVQDSMGGVYPGEQVTFVVASGGGSLSTATVSTDVNGYAEVYWTLGSTLGSQSLLVSANVVNGSPVAFTAIGKSNAGTAYTLLKISGDNQNSMANSQLTQPLKVQIQDSLGGAYVGEQVTFGVTSGGGNLSSTIVVTDVNGYAEVYWTLGNTVGSQSVSVSANVLNGSPVTFMATGTPILNTITDSRDGNVYTIITVGGQTWMAENLRYNVSGSYLNTNNPSVEYGRLYSWLAVQNICPSGWHLPSDLEWKALEMSLGMTQVAADSTLGRGTDQGVQMKSTLGWDNSGNGTNSSGFNVYPAGNYVNGTYYLLGSQGHFWTSTTSGVSAWTRMFDWSVDGVYRTEGTLLNPSLSVSFSCRCVKD